MKQNSTPRGLILVFFALAVWASCASPGGSVTTKSGLGYQIVVAANGPAALPGQSVRIHETTTLADGTLICSTRAKNRPLKFLWAATRSSRALTRACPG